jgi:hypothetical protein
MGRAGGRNPQGEVARALLAAAGCKYQGAIWLTYQYGTPGRLNPGRNGCYCSAHARLALKRAKADGLRIRDRREE